MINYAETSITADYKGHLVKARGNQYRSIPGYDTIIISLRYALKFSPGSRNCAMMQAERAAPPPPLPPSHRVKLSFADLLERDESHVLVYRREGTAAGTICMETNVT